MRLIDADALCEELGITGICKDCDHYRGWSCTDTIWSDVCNAIIDAPTVDAEPVRHGRWEPYEFGDGTWHKCSVCGTADKYINIVVRKGYPDVRLVSKRNYCPNCGCRMLKEGE